MALAGCAAATAPAEPPLRPAPSAPEPAVATASSGPETATEVADAPQKRAASSRRLRLTPPVTTVLAGRTTTLRLAPSTADAVVWSVEPGSGCGSVSSSGVYTAPRAAPASGYCRVHVSDAGGARLTTSLVWIANAPSGGTPGTWVRQKLPVSAIEGGGGAQTVLVDPVRPSDFYLFFSRSNSDTTAVLKSTDYGQTWRNVNTTREFFGNPWGAAIDPNPERDPNTPPVLFSPAGYGAFGLWKSTDGGVTWQQLFGEQESSGLGPFSRIWPPDLYAVTILPDDPPNHLLVTYHDDGAWGEHGDSGLGESFDQGKTWVAHPPPIGMGSSHYVMVVDERTWLTIGEQGSGTHGIWKTNSAGRIDGKISTKAWRPVDELRHLHGSFQSYTDPSTGALYAPGLGGIKRSADGGDTWVYVHEVGHVVSNVIGTERFLYSNFLYGPDLLRASKREDTRWESYTTPPASLVEGAPPFGAAASFDGAHWVIVMSASRHGVFRYVEP